MENKDIKIEQYWKLKGTDYPIVENLVLNQQIPDDRNTYGLSLVPTLRNRSNSDRSRLVLSFSKIRNLRLNAENSEIAFSLLTIKPVHDGWEDINFKVFNDEQDIEFSFICKDFEANIIGVDA